MNQETRLFEKRSTTVVAVVGRVLGCGDVLILRTTHLIVSGLRILEINFPKN